jgi:hypothetical protein
MRASIAIIAAALAPILAACADHGTVLRDATSDDLPRLALTQEDVPEGDADDWITREDVMRSDNTGAQDAYAWAFVVDPERRAHFGVVCTTVLMYSDRPTAEEGFTRLLQFAESQGDLGLKRLAVPSIGEKSAALRIETTSQWACAFPLVPREEAFTGEDQPRWYRTTIFLIANTVHRVTASSLIENEVSLDTLISLSRIQQERTERLLKIQ